MQPLFIKKHSYYTALISNLTHGGWGYGRQVYRIVCWIWCGLYTCVKVLYNVMCSTIALSWPDSAFNCFCAGLVWPHT